MLAVVGDFEHACGEGGRPFTFAGERLQPVQEFLDPFEFQCRAEIYGEQFAYGDHRSQSAHGQRAMFQIVVHRLLVQGGDILGKRVQRYRAALSGLLHCRQRIYRIAQAFAQLCQNGLAVESGGVALVDEDERRHTVSGQQTPQCLGMALHAIRAGDHKNRVIKHTQHTFGFGCEIHVPRRIQQGQAQVAVFHQCLVRENRDASRLLQGIGVQKRIAVIYSPQFADLTGTVEQRLGQRGLARVHMRHDACHYLFHQLCSLPDAPRNCRPPNQYIREKPGGNNFTVRPGCRYNKSPNTD